eukprot:365797-Chlamydomonas_euryale.AAC.6
MFPPFILITHLLPFPPAYIPPSLLLPPASYRTRRILHCTAPHPACIVPHPSQPALYRTPPSLHCTAHLPACIIRTQRILRCTAYLPACIVPRTSQPALHRTRPSLSPITTARLSKLGRCLANRAR